MKSIIIIVTCLLLVSNSLRASVTIKIDTDQTKEPISKYIYGQFIEHVGRGIYGGIWAEMLEDRKFYYPITDDFNPWATVTEPYWGGTGPYKYLNASPWQVIGPAGTVTMDMAEPFVGEHTPVVHLPGDGSIAGIRQDGLAIVKDKNYTGRITLAGDKDSLPISVRLILNSGNILIQEINKITPEFQTYPLRFTATASSGNVKIEIISKGKGTFKIGTLSLMPADNIKGWRKDIVKLLKELDSPVYRWPGGNFVSGYNWKDGIGERDKRPPRKNPAWKGIEHNDVGIHEYMELMELLNAEPYIVVNTGLGTVEEAAEEVEYCNSSIDTPMGKLRAQNGHPEPFDVKWWAVGNEMYGKWQAGYMAPKEYMEKHNRVAEAMWDVDRNIKLVGVGEVGYWSETMLKKCLDYMDFINENIYCKDKPNIIAHAKQLAEEIKRKANAHRLLYPRQTPELIVKNIPIVMGEWNYWYGDYIYGELGIRYHLKDALGVAIGFHEFFRNSDLFFMANYAQTVNVIGCIKASETDSAFETTGLVLKLYRNHFGTIPVELSGETGDLDISAALTEDKKAITVAIVNPTENTQQIAINFEETVIKEKGKKWTIHHFDPEAYNEPGVIPNVTIKQEDSSIENSVLDVESYTIALYRWEIQKKEERLNPELKPLVASLTNGTDEERWRAAKALGETKDRSAIKPLVIALKNDKDRRVRCRAIDALEKIGGSQIIEPLISALNDEDIDVRYGLTKALAKIGEPAIKPLISAFKDNGPAIQAGAVEALAEIGHPLATEALISILKNKDPNVRARAVEALGKMRNGMVITPLSIVLSKDKDANVRGEAALALAESGSSYPIRFIVVALEDKDNRVRFKAIEALEKAYLLRKLWLKNKTISKERLEEISVLARSDTILIVESLIPVLKYNNDHIKQKAASVLSQITGENFGIDSEKWQNWWKENKENFSLQK